MKKKIPTVEFEDNKNILHKFRNHVEHLEVYEEILNIKMSYKPISIEVIFKILIVEKIKHFYYNIPSRIILKMYCIMNIEV